MIFKKLMATILAVGVLVFGSLQLGQIPMPAAHNLCGAWGWLPETNALVSMHSIWLSLCVPIMFFLAWGFPRLGATRLWLGVGGLALLGIVFLVGFDLQEFFEGGGVRADGPKRALFVLISSTDYPLIATLIGSVVNVGACRYWRTGRAATQEIGT